VPKPKGHQTDRAPLTTWEYLALRDALDRPWGLVYDILWATGAGLRSVLALRREDLATLPLPLDLADRLHWHMMGQGRQRVFARGNHETAYTAQAAYAALKTAARKAGIRASVHPELYRRR
jgi:hypothetical protein